MSETIQASWIDALYEWADKHDIPDLQYSPPELDEDGTLLYDGYWFGLPRDQKTLLSIEALNLDGYVKSDIPDEIRHLRQLKSISITDGPKAEWDIEDVEHDLNCITEIPEWISELTNLEVLNLSYNSIAYVPSRITQLKKLRKLYLTGNRIEIITQDIDKLTNLEVLWLGCNRTSLLPESIKSHHNLKELWLDGLPGSEYGPIKLTSDSVVVTTDSPNGYSAIPLGLHKPTNILEAIKYLDEITSAEWIDELYRWADEYNIPDLKFVSDEIGDIQIGFWLGLPRNKFALLGLEELDLSWHHCTQIPEQIKHLKKLKKLSFAKIKYGLPTPADLHKNSDLPGALEEIPDWIGELDALEELDLSENNIIHLTKAVSELTNLKKLYLTGNKIMFVAPETGALSRLEVLWLRGNKLRILEDSIERFTNATQIDVDLNQENKILVLIDCIEQLKDLNFEDEQYTDLTFDVASGKFDGLQKGLAHARQLTGSRNNQLVWKHWQELSDLRRIINQLPSLREVWCDGLKSSRHGPIFNADHGIEVIELKEVDYDRPVILSNDEIEERVVIECNATLNRLGEKLEQLNMWDKNC